MADPKWSSLSGSNTGSRLNNVQADAIHLSDGTLVWLEYDAVAGDYNLCYSSDHATRNVISASINGSAVWVTSGGQQSLALIRDNLDNLYVVGTSTTNQTMVRCQAWTKGAGYTWTPQTGVNSAGSSVTWNIASWVGVWCNTGGGTNSKGHLMCIGEASTDCGYAILDAGVALAGTGTLTVNSAAGPTFLGTSLNNHGSNNDISPDGFGATSGIAVVEYSTNIIQIGAWSVTSAGALSTNTSIGQTTIGTLSTSTKTRVVRCSSNLWAIIGPSSTATRYMIARYSSTAQLTAPTDSGAPTNMPLNGSTPNWDVFLDPNVANRVWIIAAGTQSGSNLPMWRLQLDLGSGVTVAGAATADATLTPVTAAIGATLTTGGVRAVKQPSASVDWQVFVQSAATPTYALYGDYTSFASAPNADTLTSPSNGGYLDVSGGVTFQSTYNATDGANANAYALRAKQAGGSYVYWNAGSSLWQGTIVWNTLTTAPSVSRSVAVPASATISNGFTLNWSMASQESISNLQGAFATDFSIVMQAAPTVSVTAPSGTITTLTPTVAWTTSPGAGAVQTAYRVVAYNPTQYGGGGFSPGVTAGDYDSGVVSGNAQARQIPSGVLTAGITYRFYVQVTETGPETSTWQFTSATPTLDPPADPTIVATPGTDATTGAPRTSVVVQGRDNLLTAEQASLEAGTAAGWAAGANTVIGATGGANLLTAEQSSFEGGTTAGWTPTGATAANSTTQAAQGTHSMTLTATGANVISASTPTGTSGFVVTASTRYTALASFRTVATARSMSVQILWYQASGAASAVRASDTGTAVTDATGSWVQGFVTAIAPSDAAFAAIVVLSNVAVVLSEVHYVDGISLAAGFDLRWAVGGTAPAAMSLNGTRSLSIVALAGANPASATTPTGTSGFAVTPSQQVTAQANFRSAVTARTCTVQILWYQASGAASAVRASDTSAGTADSTSAWTQVSLTVTAPSDAAFAAVVPLVNGALATSEQHFVDEIDIGPGSSTVWTRGGLSGLTAAVVQYSDDGGVTWSNMRTSGASFAFPAQALTLLDYEAPPGAVRRYRAQVQANVGATIASNIVQTTATGTIPTQWVISDPTDTTSGLLFHASGSVQRNLVERETVHAPLGRAKQVRVSDGPKGWAGRLQVRTTSTAQQSALEALLARNVTLLVQSPEGGGRQWYANVSADPSVQQNERTLGANVLGGVAGRGTTRMPHSDLSLTYVEAERP